MKVLPKSEEEWKNKLTKEQYEILRMKGTEKPFTGKLLENKKSGTYNCMACGNPLFKSDSKFDSGTGWPSFDESLPNSVELKKDISHGMIRTEVICKRCKSHLGHLFNDGPTSSGKRYCLNSVCLNFRKE